MPDGTATISAGATKTLDELGKILIAEINQAVTGGDQHVPKSDNNFISWCMPGLPFEPSDFAFCVKGLYGGADAEEQKALIEQAFSLANLVDFVPDNSAVYDGDKQQTVWRTSQARLSYLYGEILNFAKVVTYELSDAEKVKLDKFRGLLRKKTTKKDIITDQEVEVWEDGDINKQYKEKMAEYQAQALLYNSKRIAAATATGPEGKAAVLDFSTNAPLYRMMVQTAMNDWIANGYHNEVLAMHAYINGVTQRDLMLWKQRLQEMYSESLVTGLAPGEQFYFTTLFPANFAAARGWTQYNCSESHVRTSESSSTTSYGGSAGLNFGLFRIGGGATHAETRQDASTKISAFKLSMELTQAVISRPWFYPEFFMNRGWTLRKGEGWMYEEMPSDGKTPPSGNLIAYPTMAIFARNITIESADFATALSATQSSTSAGATIGYGPFSLSGNYSHSESGRKFAADVQGGVIKVPGMQVIGFVNHLIPRAPDPLPELKEEDFH